MDQNTLLVPKLWSVSNLVHEVRVIAFDLLSTSIKSFSWNDDMVKLKTNTSSLY